MMPSSRTARLLATLALGALAVSGMVSAPLLAPAPAEAAYPGTFNPFAMNGGFTVYARGDVSLGNHETEGSIAAGGTATKPGSGQYTIVHVVAGTADYSLPVVDGDPTRLLAGSFSTASGGITSITSAGTDDPTLQGMLKLVSDDGWTTSQRGGSWIRLNTTDAAHQDVEPIIDSRAQSHPEHAARPDTAVGGGSILTYDTSATAVADYVESNAESSYADAAACLAALPTTAHHVTIAEDVGDRIVLGPLSADQANIVDYADIARAGLLQFSSDGVRPGAANPLIIRVPAGTALVSPARIDPQGEYSPYTLWDLSAVTGAVRVDAGGVRIDGSIYAPEADLTVSASPLDGQVIGRDVVLLGGEVHSFLFAGRIACDAEHGGFRVRKQLAGIAPEDLPADAAFAVSFTATAPDGEVTTGSLELPADGGWVDPGLSLPAGTSVVFTEGEPRTVPDIEWTGSVVVPARLVIGTGTSDVTLTNTAVQRTGTFTVAKLFEVLDGDDAAAASGTASVAWTAFDGQTQIDAGRIEPPLDGTPVPVGRDFPLGTRIELSEDLTGLQAPDGFHWVDAAYAPGDAFTIGDGTTVAVALTNTLAADDPEGTISLVKSAIGVGADAGYEYTVTYNAEPAPTRAQRQLAVGDPVALDDVEAGADTLELAEQVPVLDGVRTDPASWEPPVFRVDVDGTVTEYAAQNFEGDGDLATAIVSIPLDADADVVVEVVNERRSGTFELAKRFVDGGDQLAPPAHFPVSWTATAPDGSVSDGVLHLPGDGASVGPEHADGSPLLFPFGTRIDYTELAPPLKNWIDWEPPVDGTGSLTIGADAATTVAATITNRATIRTGGFAVAKRVIGVDPAEVLIDGFTIDYTAALPTGSTQTGSFSVPADGAPAGPVDSDGAPIVFPVGTVVRLAEVAPDDSALPDDLGWAATTWWPGDSLVIDEGAAPVLEVTNSVVRLARFTVEKHVVGDGTELVPDDVVFPVFWQPTVRTALLEARIGAPVQSPLLPVGTIVELREGERPVVEGVEWGEAAWSHGGDPLVPDDAGTVSLVVEDEGAGPMALELTNTALLVGEEDPDGTNGPGDPDDPDGPDAPDVPGGPDSPGDPDGPGAPDDGSLPTTGGDGSAVPALLAIALLLIGAVLVIRRRAV